jgi:hypothetical protein
MGIVLVRREGQLKALLRKIGAALEADGFLRFRGNIFEDDAKKLVGEIEDTHVKWDYSWRPRGKNFGTKLPKRSRSAPDSGYSVEAGQPAFGPDRERVIAGSGSWIATAGCSSSDDVVLSDGTDLWDSKRRTVRGVR